MLTKIVRRHGNAEKFFRISMTDKNKKRYKKNTNEPLSGQENWLVCSCKHQASDKSTKQKIYSESINDSYMEKVGCDSVVNSDIKRSLSGVNRSGNFCCSVFLPTTKISSSYKSV